MFFLKDTPTTYIDEMAGIDSAYREKISSWDFSKHHSAILVRCSQIQFWGEMLYAFRLSCA